jgi:hypothetical protein
MTKRWIAAVSALVVLTSALIGAPALEAQQTDDQERLVVIWRSADPEIFHSGLYLYTHNAKRFKWFDEVTVIVWGPALKLLAEDEEILARVRKMQADGVVVMADIDAANDYGLQETIRDDLGIRVMILGPFLTRFLQEDARVLTF